MKMLRLGPIAFEWWGGLRPESKTDPVELGGTVWLPMILGVWFDYHFASWMIAFLVFWMYVILALGILGCLYILAIVLHWPI